MGFTDTGPRAGTEVGGQKKFHQFRYRYEASFLHVQHCITLSRKKLQYETAFDTTFLFD